jgi:cyclohexyl-isocyanide hydratase
MRILSLAFPGFTFVDLAGPLQAFSILPGFESQLAWKQPGIIPSDAGVSVVATTDFKKAWADPDVLFVPGNTKALFALLEDNEVLDFIESRGANAKWITSVCNGSLLLGAAGLLEGYEAGCYWYARDKLKAFGAIPKPGRIVIDRNRATGGGMTAGIDFGIKMIGVLAGDAMGRTAELLFEYAPEPPYGTGRPELADEQTLAGARGLVSELMPLEKVVGAAENMRRRKAISILQKRR